MSLDTVYALSTAPGQAGVAVVRISGPRARAVLETMVEGKGAAETGKDLIPPRQACLLSLVDPQEGAAIDRCLGLWFPAPASFTGEDVLELHLHGGRAVVQGAIEALGKLPGFRPAEAGEFTRRAFDNGKLDLTEVEGLADLIAAETEAQRKQALRQMDGRLSRLIDGWRTDLIRTLAHLEAEIDFPDEELEEGISEQVILNISSLSEKVRQHLADGHRGERLRDGFTIAIVGPPNAGKSSLLNVLAQRDVAIVSDTAGTTRDIIEVHLDLAGYPVTLADTAGLRDLRGRRGDGIEEEGMRRARLRAESADLRLAVFDVADYPDLDKATLNLLAKGDSLILFNKVDRLADEGEELPGELAGIPLLTISVKQGRGVGQLLTRLQQEVVDRLGTTGTAPSITRERHRKALTDCAEALERSLGAGLPELMAEDLRLATRHLGRITGKVDVEDLLDVIFRDFCIGK